MAIGSEAMALAIGSEFTPVTASEEAAHQASSSESNGAAAAEASLEDTKEVDDEMSMPPKLSLCLILCMAFLTCANLVIVIPTATGYAQVLGGNSTLSGLLIGVTPILASFGVFGTYWVVKRSSFSTVIQCLNFGVVCGNILYALAELTGWPFTILFARSLIGFCGGLVIPPFYITQVVGIKRRSEVMFYFSAANVLGMAAGPLFAWLVEEVVHRLQIENLVWNTFTAPGWFMAAMYLIYMLLFGLLFQEPPATQAMISTEAKEPESRPGTGPSPLELVDQRHTSLVGPIVCIWVTTVAGILNTCCEVYAVKMAQDYWGWTIANSALFLSAIVFVAGAVNLLMGRLTSKSQVDQLGLLLASLLAGASAVLLLDYGLGSLAEQVAVFALGLTLLLSSINVARSFAMPLATKLVPLKRKQRTSLWAMIGMSMGRGCGAILGSALTRATFGYVALGFCLSAALSVAACQRKLKIDERAG